MGECSSGKCGVGENPSRNAHYVLRCSNDDCAAVFPLTKELNDRQMCPRCNRALLIWYPKEWVKKRGV